MTTTAMQEWVRAFIAEAGADAQVEAFVTRVDDAILAELPELASEPVLVADLHASTRAQFQVFLSLLERERQELLLPPQAVDLAMSIARRQLDLNVLLKVYRVAAHAVWGYFTEVAAAVPEDGPDRTDVLVYLWDHGGTWINEAIEQLIGVFYAEREATLQGTLASRVEAVHALPRGEAADADAASRLLQHPLRSVQTALVVWADGGTAASHLDLTRAAETAGAALGAAALVVPAGRSESWCWLATATAPDRGDLDAAVRQAVPTGLRVAIGRAASGVEGFRAGHREAVDAQRCALATGEEGVVHYDDVELACLVAGNEAAARSIVTRELGRLAEDDEAMARLRETLSTYLSCGGNVEQTATTLFVHKNTIRYRLGQVEDLLGHPLAERRTELGVALACWERFGPGQNLRS